MTRSSTRGISTDLAVESTVPVLYSTLRLIKKTDLDKFAVLEFSFAGLVEFAVVGRSPLWDYFVRLQKSSGTRFLKQLQ
jgi:hypothetical protein